MRLLLLLALLPAFTADTTRTPLDPLPNASVGRVAGTGAFVAVSRERGRVRVYVCDGTLQRDAKIAAWFRGREGTLRAAGHTLTLRGNRGTFDGRPFTLRRAKAPAGLLQGSAGGIATTWIVRADGSKRGNFVPTRPPRCRIVVVTSSSGQSQYVTVC